MRFTFSTVTLIFAALLAMPALAQPPAEDGDRERQRDRPRRVAPERILRAFDKDGDGRLNEAELDTMRQQLGDRFERIRTQVRERGDERRPEDARRREDRRAGAPERERPARDGDRERRRPARDDDERGRDARRDTDRPREGDRPREADRPRAADRPREADRPRPRPDRPRDVIRRRGPIGPVGGPRERDLGALFGWFDTDGDNMLNRREFAELSQFVDRRRPGPPGGPVSLRFGRRGPDGPRPGLGRDDVRRLELRRRIEVSRRGDGPGRERDDRRTSREERPRGDRPNRPDNAPDRRPEARPNAADAI